MSIVSDKHFREIAFKNYNNPQCIHYSEFEADLKKFNCFRNIKLTTPQVQTNLTNLRKTLNQIIIVHNLFGKFTAEGLFYKTDRKYWSELKTILDYLQLIPPHLPQNVLANNKQIVIYMDEICKRH